ncbi:hypothetical protein B1806_04210 [Metallibacterium scheffleri]|uniref:Uncharacterized protein n=1 Tax=Metallibacterium scheffleri TaxID=993689 RepID=A0A4V3UTN7_9GAMM|nr:hypothetical protein B1806_04210 [Metallibacterium scheffleri]
MHWNHELLVHQHDRLPCDIGWWYRMHPGPGQCGYVHNLLAHLWQHRIRHCHVPNPQHHRDDVLVLELFRLKLPCRRHGWHMARGSLPMMM